MILLCVWPGATCSLMRAKLLFIHFCPSSYSLGWINSWTWKNINKLSWFLELSPPSRTWSHGTFPSKSLKWLNSALLNSRVASFLSDLCFLLMVWTTTSHCCYGQVCLQSWHLKQVPPCLWGTAKHLSPPSPIYRGKSSYQGTPGSSWIACADVSFKIWKKNCFLHNTFMNTFYFLGLHHKIYSDSIYLCSEKYFSLHCHTTLFQSNYFAIRIYQSLLITRNYSWRHLVILQKKDVHFLQHLKLYTWKTSWVTIISEWWYPGGIFTVCLTIIGCILLANRDFSNACTK